MNRKESSLTILALCAALLLPGTAIADDHDKKETPKPKPEFVAEDDKKETPKPELIAVGEDKRDSKAGLVG